MKKIIICVITFIVSITAGVGSFAVNDLGSYQQWMDDNRPLIKANLHKDKSHKENKHEKDSKHNKHDKHDKKDKHEKQEKHISSEGHDRKDMRYQYRLKKQIIRNPIPFQPLTQCLLTCRKNLPGSSNI